MGTPLCCQEVRGISTTLTIFQGLISPFGISRPLVPFFSQLSCLPFGNFSMLHSKTQSALLSIWLSAQSEAIEGSWDGTRPWIVMGVFNSFNWFTSYKECVRSNIIAILLLTAVEKDKPIMGQGCSSCPLSSQTHSVPVSPSRKDIFSTVYYSEVLVTQV